jgi:hypothetical protein
MQALIDTITNYWIAFIGFFTGVFASIKSFFDALLETIGNYYDSFITYFNNVFLSLKLFLIDLPLVVLKKIFSAITWLFQWASDSCSYYMGGASNAGSLAGKFQQAWDSMASHTPGILYLVNRSGILEAMQILTCGLLLWSVFKVISFIKAIL